VLVVAMALAGCGGAYTTPPPGGDLSLIGGPQRLELEGRRAVQSDASVRELMDRKPLASFPAAIAVVRVQSAGYRTRTADGYGAGGVYSIVTQRDVETDVQFGRLAGLPQVAGLAPVTRLLLPPTIDGDRPLRDAAAGLRADITLVYTIDTRFHTTDRLRPVSVISLGLLQPARADVRTTASAMFMDTRNGYVYGVAEASSQREQRTNNWTSTSEIDRLRLENEREAFEKLVAELEKSWAGIVDRYAAPRASPQAGG
jgi:hypothetical protein